MDGIIWAAIPAITLLGGLGLYAIWIERQRKR